MLLSFPCLNMSFKRKDEEKQQRSCFIQNFEFYINDEKLTLGSPLLSQLLITPRWMLQTNILPFLIAPTVLQSLQFLHLDQLETKNAVSVFQEA